MPVYPLPFDDPDGRALGRALAALRKADEAAARSRGVITNPTPPAQDVAPGPLTRAVLEGGRS